MAFGRLERTRGAEPMSDINVTPLVDVMLVLVVIFILSAPLLASSLRLQLPVAQQAQPGAGAGVLAVALDAQGQLSVDGQDLAPEALAERLQAAAARQPGLEVQLHADAAVPYGQIVRIIDAARAAGLQRIAFAAQAAQDVPRERE